MLAALWFLAVGPKRTELTTLSKEVEKSEQAARTAQENAQQSAEARLSFPRAYASMVRLGKAVPADPDVPSLLVQLEDAAETAGVDFRKVELKSGGERDAGAGQPSDGGQASAQTASSGAGPTGSGAPSGSESGSSGGQTPGAGGAESSPAGGGSSPAPANALAVATQPIGTSVGPAGFPLIKLALGFEGSFFKMADFIGEIKGLVEERNQRLLVSGRLISIDGIVFGEGAAGFPQVKATIAATTYLVPNEQGLLAGATAQGPAAGTPSAPASPGGPPTAVVTTP
jgi:hypothetical protein